MLALFLALLIALASPLSASPRGMVPEDIIHLQKPQSVTLSPDGTKVAYVVETADLTQNKPVYTVHVWNGADQTTQTLWALDSVKRLQWQDSDALYVLGTQAELYQICVADGLEKKVLVSSLSPIAVFALSADGRHLYYTQTVYTPEDVVQRHLEEGYVYRFGIDSAGFILGKKEYAHCEWEEIWHLDRTTNKTESKAKIPYEQWFDAPSYNRLYNGLILAMQPSPDGRYLSLNTWRIGNSTLGEKSFMNDLVVVDLETGARQTLRTDSLTLKTTPCWTKDRLIFQEVDFRDGSTALVAWNPLDNICSFLHDFHAGRRFHSLVWNEEIRSLIAEDGHQLLRISLEDRETEAMDLPNFLFHPSPIRPMFSFDASLRYFATVTQNPTTPPQVVVYDWEKDHATQISDLNPQLANILLGKVEKIVVETADYTADGYLIHPVDEKKRAPCIIATYGFSGQTFLADGEWHSSFPARPLAARGYAVLLLNTPTSKGQQSGVRSSAQLMGLLEANKPIFERAVDMLDAQGLIDPNKVGLYGWSHGAFVVEYLISHSDRFHAACIGEGGDYNPSGFWLSGDLVSPRTLANTFGGPPWGPSLQNYLSLSPFFSVDKIKAPLLMEFGSGKMQGLELYTPLRYLGVPAELVIYEGEAHNFAAPKARLASMARKIDWFDRWLFRASASKDKSF